MTTQRDATQLLHDVRSGSREAVDELFALTYDELKRLARHRIRRQQPGETLSTTALVHEAYVRLVDQRRVRLADRAHFLALASRVMRFVLVDHFRARAAMKRGSAAGVLPLDVVQIPAESGAPDVVAVHEALDELMGFSPRLGQLVEYRFFGGLTYEEIAEVTGASVPTVKRDWTRARAWLFHAMQSDVTEPDRSRSEPGSAPAAPIRRGAE
jgi:RNA polymerase sigma factor (TIGR02999 family)